MKWSGNELLKQLRGQQKTGKKRLEYLQLIGSGNIAGLH